ncbi:MAG: FHA domain-containing protein [Anaerolineaceae bacterium]|nr:FHA domain-containing protein [Anaerolineaceae bacterium]
MKKSAILTKINKDTSREEWIIKKEEFLIGRDEGVDLAFDTPKISRNHALIILHTKRYYIIDLTSLNGTFVNGKLVDRDPTRLKDGDEIVLGGEIKLLFQNSNETISGFRIGKLEGLWIDMEYKDVWINTERVEPALSNSQFQLLTLIYNASGKVISREQIIRDIWVEVNPAGVSHEAVDSLIKRLRSRLKPYDLNHNYINVIRGQGIKFVQK